MMSSLKSHVEKLRASLRRSARIVTHKICKARVEPVVRPRRRRRCGKRRHVLTTPKLRSNRARRVIVPTKKTTTTRRECSGETNKNDGAAATAPSNQVGKNCARISPPLVVAHAVAPTSRPRPRASLSSYQKTLRLHQDSSLGFTINSV